MTERFMANIGAKIRSFQRKMKEVDKKVRETAMGTEVPVGADISEANRKMGLLQKVKESLNDKVVVPIEARVNKFQKQLNRIANVMQSAGTVAGSSFRGGFIAALPALAPIIASSVGGLGGLASSFTALGGGLGAFGLAAIGNASKLTDSMSDLQKIRDKIASEKQSLDPNQEKINELMNERKNILNNMSAAQQSAMQQFNKFRSAWNKFLEVTQKPVFKVFSAGLKTATSLLHEIKPIIKPISDTLVDLLNQFNNFSKTEQFRSFIDFFAGRGSSALKNWGQIAGNAFRGFMELMKAFGPLGADMEKGLIGMTKSFADWAAGLSKSKSFQKFIDFVKTNGPKVMSLIGNLTKFIINLGVGMAPLGSKILDLVNGFLSWMNSMMKANPIIGQVISWVTSLIGVILAITPGILLFGGTFISIITKVGGILKWFIGGPIGLLVSALIMIVPFVIKNWDDIWQGTQQIFTMIGNFLKGIWTWIKNMFNGALNWIDNVTNGKFTLITNTIRKYWNMVGQNIKDVWNWIKGSFKRALKFIKAIVSGDFGKAKNLIKEQMQKSKELISRIWNRIKNFFKDILTDIVGAVVGKFVDLKNSVKDGMNKAYDKVQDIGGNIVDFFGNINLFDAGKKIIGSAIDGIVSMKDKIMDRVSDITSGIRDFWPFSPAKDGALSDIHRMDFAGPISTSIAKAKTGVMRSMSGLAGAARRAFQPNLALADMGVSATLDASISSRDMSAIKSGLSVDVDDFELPQNDEQYAVFNIGGYEAKGVVKYITDEQEREKGRRERFR
ncbi:phage tail protein [Virgibacillus doumboii]|uniref:phage tail protein n=1 Tax=Virgibacillus doumboii TaxID=2697503 RepID=UPI0013DFA425|nr:hypothetical protein [Virgibacillus doumboii]